MEESIETEDEYINLIKTAKSPPFIIVNKNDFEVKDFDRVIENKYRVPKNFQISKAVKIHYYPNGKIDVFTDYDDFDTALPAEILGVSKEKVKNLKALLPYQQMIVVFDQGV
ncbi:hypothetical protein ABEB36_015162 [Hypothenemus hampei]|uniref:Uncharacterized protein n=1 Tax=Hypothenemus hampei TaxID=57062 RepID=A0ABD1E0V2_HYPHA